jgi:hypothetical protein
LRGCARLDSALRHPTFLDFVWVLNHFYSFAGVSAGEPLADGIDRVRLYSRLAYDKAVYIQGMIKPFIFKFGCTDILCFRVQVTLLDCMGVHFFLIVWVSNIFRCFRWATAR